MKVRYCRIFDFGYSTKKISETFVMKTGKDLRKRMDISRANIYFTGDQILRKRSKSSTKLECLRKIFMFGKYLYSIIN